MSVFECNILGIIDYINLSRSTTVVVTIGYMFSTKTLNQYKFFVRGNSNLEMCQKQARGCSLLVLCGYDMGLEVDVLNNTMQKCFCMKMMSGQNIHPGVRVL